MDRHEWDRRYSEAGFVWTTEPNRFVVAELADLPPGRAIDLGAGEGRNAVWLAERGWKVTGVDFSEVGLAKARALAEERGVEVEWVLADLRSFVPPPGSFDLVLIAYVQLPPAERTAVLHRAGEALRPGGTLLVVAHDLANLTEGVGGPQNPEVLYTPQDVAADLAGLRVERADRVRRPVETPQGPREAVDTLVRAIRD